MHSLTLIRSRYNNCHRRQEYLIILTLLFCHLLPTQIHRPVGKKCFGLVCFTAQEEAQKARTNMNGYPIISLPLRVDLHQFKVWLILLVIVRSVQCGVHTYIMSMLCHFPCSLSRLLSFRSLTLTLTLLGTS